MVREERGAVAHHELLRTPIFRIAPIYWLGIPLYAAAEGAKAYFVTGSFTVPKQYVPVNVIANLLFLHGLYPPATNSIVPGGWSVGTEAAFYLVFPLLMTLVDRFELKTLGRWMTVVFAWSAIVQAVVLVLWWVCGVETRNNSFIYFNIGIQSQVFLVGLAFYHVYTPRSLTILHVAMCCIAFALLTALTGWLWSLHVGHVFSIIPLIVGVCCCFVIVLLEMMPLLCLLIVCKIGRVSYSMYLFHWLVVPLGVRLVSSCVGTTLTPEVLLAVSYAVIVAVTFAIAQLSERYVERPGIALGKRVLGMLDAAS